MKTISWQYCRNPNEINTAIASADEDWEGLEDAEQIVSITWDTNHNCYVVFWKTEEAEEEVACENCEYYLNGFCRYVSVNGIITRAYEPCSEFKEKSHG